MAADPASAATTTGLEPVGPVSDVVQLLNLPECAGAGIMDGTDGHGRQPAADLGWVGKPKVGATYGAAVSEIVPAIPCRRDDGSGPYLNVVLIGNNITGSGYRGGGYMSLQATCYNVSTHAQTVVAGGSDQVWYPIQGATAPYAVHRFDAQAITNNTCTYITQVRVTLTLNSSGHDFEYQAIADWTWKASQWRTGDGGWKPATTPNDLLPAGVELPIVCIIDTSGDDPLTILGHVFTSLWNWVPCMLIPVGWDRAGLIEAGWQAGPIGQLTAAYQAAVPDGIACGVVATLPVFNHDITLNTCGADIAPTVVKTVIGWLMVLGIAALVVRRIMWAVGSRA